MGNLIYHVVSIITIPPRDGFRVVTHLSAPSQGCNCTSLSIFHMVLRYDPNALAAFLLAVIFSSHMPNTNRVIVLGF